MSTFIYPSVKRVTSHFRTKTRPDHNGTDFAEKGEQKIVAVADGKVSKSYVSDSYGETIMIVHDVNGQTWESLYAHMKTGSRKFNEGDTVKQGDVIGLMGNTGNSSGQHLHFELHKGRWNYEKSNAVNPLDHLKEKTVNKQVKKGQKEYKVKQGDYLGKIAEKFDASVDQIMKMNDDIRNPNMIQVDQIIIVPDNKETFIEYKVKRGDTLGKIANKHEVSIKAILQSNNEIKNANLIYPNQVLKIPK